MLFVVLAHWSYLFKLSINLFTLVDNIGLTCSAESMHTIAARRLSRRGTASRHHPHRTSSRRNKENGNGVHRNSIGRTSGSASNSTNHDDLRNQRKQRTVSFEQNQLPSPTDYCAPTVQWNEATHSTQDLYNSAIRNSVAEPTESSSSYQLKPRYSPPRV